MDYKQKTIYLGTAVTTAPVKTGPAYPRIGQGPAYLAWRDNGGIVLKYELEGGGTVFEAPVNPVDGHWTQLAWIKNDGWRQLPQDLRGYIIYLVDASIELRPHNPELTIELRQVQFDLWRRICQAYDAATADSKAAEPEPISNCRRLVECWKKFDWQAYADLRNAIDKCFDDTKLDKIDCFRHRVNSNTDIRLTDWHNGVLWLQLIEQDDESAGDYIVEVAIPGEYLEDEGSIEAEIDRLNQEELKRLSEINAIKNTEEYREHLRLKEKFKDID